MLFFVSMTSMFCNFADIYAFAASTYLALGPIFGPVQVFVHCAEPLKNPNFNLSLIHTILALLCSVVTVCRIAWLPRLCVAALALGALWAHVSASSHWVWDPIEILCVIAILFSYVSFHCSRVWSKRWLFALLCMFILSRAGWLNSAHSIITASSPSDIHPAELVLWAVRFLYNQSTAPIWPVSRVVLAHKAKQHRRKLHASLAFASKVFTAPLFVLPRGRQSYTISKDMTRDATNLWYRP